MALLNYDADATADDGSCFLPSCDASGTGDSTSYILHLNHDIYLSATMPLTSTRPVATPSSTPVTSIISVPCIYEGKYQVDGYWFCIPSDACLQFSGGGGSPAGLPIWKSWTSPATCSTRVDSRSAIGFGASADNCVSGWYVDRAINYDPAATIDDGSCVVWTTASSVCTSPSRTTSAWG